VVKDMSNTIEAVFDGKVFRPEQTVELKPNTRVEITVTIKNVPENTKEFRVRSKHLGFRKDLNYDKTSKLLEEIESLEK
jgi:predicted DNA-binding antitoxin AbrB/MazE fold protein